MVDFLATKVYKLRVVSSPEPQQTRSFLVKGGA